MGLCDGLVEGSELGLSLNVAVGPLLVDGASVDAGLLVGACNYYDERSMKTRMMKNKTFK